jgi:hypothetical protein
MSVKAAVVSSSVVIVGVKVFVVANEKSGERIMPCRKSLV